MRLTDTQTADLAVILSEYQADLIERARLAELERSLPDGVIRIMWRWASIAADIQDVLRAHELSIVSSCDESV